MWVSFARTAGERDRFYVQPPDDSEASWNYPSYGDAVPRDLVHFVVERALGMSDGIWARAA